MTIKIESESNVVQTRQDSFESIETLGNTSQAGIDPAFLIEEHLIEPS